MRLTLLWSQSTTGDYFEEENALSIGFRFRNSGRRRAPVLDGLNWWTLNNKTRQVQRAPHPLDVQTEVKSLKPTQI